MIPKLHVALLDRDTTKHHHKRLRSVLGRITWQLARDRPVGPWFLDNRAAITSPTPMLERTVTYRYGDKEHHATVIPVERTHTPNLWDIADRTALSSMLGSSLRSAIERTEAMDYWYDRSGGVLRVRDPTVLAGHYPTWSGKSSPDEVASLWNIQHGPKLRGTDTFVFNPYRYIDFRPTVGLRGQPMIQFGFSTRMQTNPEFTLNRIYHKQNEWDRALENPRFTFRLALPSTKGMRVQPDTGTWLLNRFDARPMSDAMTNSRSAMDELRSFLHEYGVSLTPAEESRIEQDTAVHITRNVFDDDPETLAVPARYLVPGVDLGNAYFYTKFTDTELTKAYTSLTHIATPTKAGMFEAISNYLGATLRAEIALPDELREIRFSKGSWETPTARTGRGRTLEERRQRLTGQPTLFDLAEPQALLRRRGVFVPVSFTEFVLGEDEDEEPDTNAGGLMPYVFHGEFQVYRAAQPLSSGLKIAIIAPSQKTTGGRPVVADLLPATFRFDADAILPPSQRNAPRKAGRVNPLKNLPERLEGLRNFFEAKPMDAWFEPVTGDRADAESYTDAMGRAMVAGAKAFIVILPRGVSPRTQDEIYFQTHNFGFKEQLAVVHFEEGRWKKDTTFYQMVYGTLAKLNTRLGGLNFKIDLAKTVPLLERYPNILIVGYDFGRSQKDYLGVITATDAATQDMVAHQTGPIGNVTEAVEELDNLLGNITHQYNPDLVVVLRDSKFAGAEMRGLRIHYDKLGIPTIPLETLKNGGLSGYKYTAKGRTKGIKIVSPYAKAFYTPEMHINVFGSTVNTKQGIWRAIRFAVNPQPFPFDLDFDYEDIANLGFGLSKMGGYFSDPSKTKYPDILGRADKLVELYQGGALVNVGRAIGAREFDP